MPVPVIGQATCPRCKTRRSFLNTDGSTPLYRCAGCEWLFTLGTQAPTGTTNAAITAGVTTALPVASGGTSFTNGMFVLVDTGTAEELVQVTGVPTGTSVPVLGGFARNHNSGAAIGQVLLTPATTTAERVPSAPAWGF
jgi:hypothetical protein